jgi:hypothetical protein
MLPLHFKRGKFIRWSRQRQDLVQDQPPAQAIDQGNTAQEHIGLGGQPNEQPRTAQLPEGFTHCLVTVIQSERRFRWRDLFAFRNEGLFRFRRRLGNRLGEAALGTGASTAGLKANQTTATTSSSALIAAIRVRGLFPETDLSSSTDDRKPSSSSLIFGSSRSFCMG